MVARRVWDCRWLSVGLAHRLLDVFGEVGGSQIVIGLVDDVANVPDINAGEQCSSLVLELGSGRIARPCETDCGRRAKSVGEVGELTQDATGWHLTVCNIHSITAVVEKAVQNAGRIEKGDSDATLSHSDKLSMCIDRLATASEHGDKVCAAERCPGP